MKQLTLESVSGNTALDKLNQTPNWKVKSGKVSNKLSWVYRIYNYFEINLKLQQKLCSRLFDCIVYEYCCCNH